MTSEDENVETRSKWDVIMKGEKRLEIKVFVFPQN